MKTMLRFVAFFAILSAACFGQEFCSLAVEVPSAANGIYVFVYEADGGVQVELTKEGIARFCGLGIRPVDIRVGRDCAPVTITGVMLRWGETRHLRVLYSDGQCMQDRSVLAQSPVCFLLLRFRVDEAKGPPVAGVVIQPSGSSKELKSDQWGRVMLSMRKDEDFHAVATSAGFASETIDFACTMVGWEGERIVVLKSRR